MRAAVFALVLSASAAAQTPIDPDAYRDAADRIINAALADSAAYERTVYMGDTFGHRFSGSASLEAAIDWILEEMAADGLENVHGQPVLVPAWIRGAESVTLTAPREEPLAMLGLGGSVGTPPAGIEADVLVVGSFDELAERADEAAGKVVLYDVPFTSYGRTVPYRTRGAVEAARVGAVASLVRSVGPVSLSTPHTGTMQYEEGVARIPHAAITVEASAMLRRMAERGTTPRVRIHMEARTEPDRMSRNVIGELRGREFSDEVVVLGGHIDSWDAGQGMHDDGGGCVVAWEAVRLLHDLGLQPRRTIRVVLWTNEENGLRGATTYRDSIGAATERHQLAIESDGGVFEPLGFGVSGADGAFEALAPITDLLAPVLGTRDGSTSGITRGGGGADIGPLMQAGVPGAGHRTANDRYFWYHHTAADTADKLDAGHLQRNVAAMAILAYVAAEMPERLPQGDYLGAR